VFTSPGCAGKVAKRPREWKSKNLNAVEIEEAISALDFDAREFPLAFLEAFGNRPTTIKRLRSGSSNKSDLGGVLQTNNILRKTLALLGGQRTRNQGELGIIRGCTRRHGADATIGVPGAYSNSTYYQSDFTHLTNAGSDIVKPIVKTTILSI
jgi:hypothetical protein